MIESQDIGKGLVILAVVIAVLAAKKRFVPQAAAIASCIADQLAKQGYPIDPSELHVMLSNDIGPFPMIDVDSGTPFFTLNGVGLPINSTSYYTAEVKMNGVKRIYYAKVHSTFRKIRRVQVKEATQQSACEAGVPDASQP